MLRVERIITFTLIIGLAAAAVVNWRRANLFQADNEQLRAKAFSLEGEIAETGKNAHATVQELETLKQRSAELMKLRNEVTQLRSSNQVVATLSAENQRLKADLQRRGGAAQPAGNAAAANPNTDPERFPRENWRFAGYGTPENALVSAIWSMREGNSQSYLASLSPAEQERAAATWQAMSPDQVAAKHKNDVANITGMRILEQQNLAPDEVLMSVYLEGSGRMERVRLNNVSGEWKFGGFVRQGPGAPPAQ